MKMHVLCALFCCLALVGSACTGPGTGATQPTSSAPPTTQPSATTSSTATPEPATVPPASLVAPTYQVTTTSGSWPSRRGGHSAVYDDHHQKMVVFGGGPDLDHHLSETWIFDPLKNTWQQITSEPAPDTCEGPMAYDSAADVTVFFEGGTCNDLTAIFQLGAAAKTWKFDLTTATWTDLQAKGTPSGLLGARMAYDSKSDVMILFGGVKVPLTSTSTDQFVYLADTWSYDMKTNTWTNMHPQSSPPATAYFEMAYDAKNDRVAALVMPYDAGAEMNLWLYDYARNTWAKQPAKGPQNRLNGAMIYDPALAQLLLFAGTTAISETPFGDLWSYDVSSNTWKLITNDSGPQRRGFHSLVYIPSADQILVFGGGRSGNDSTDEAWVFSPKNNAWSQIVAK